MKKIMLMLALAFPMASQADYVDVIAGKLKPGCTVPKYLQIVQDFRDQWANANGYKVEILFPAQSRDLSTIYWVGRMANFEAFGKVADSWTAAMADANSVPAKLAARLGECTTNESRAGYFTR
jgi:hypothetical protein